MSEGDKHSPITNRAGKEESGCVEPSCFGSEFNMSKPVCLESNEAAESRYMLAQGMSVSKAKSKLSKLTKVE